MCRQRRSELVVMLSVPLCDPPPGVQRYCVIELAYVYHVFAVKKPAHRLSLLAWRVHVYTLPRPSTSITFEFGK